MLNVQILDDLNIVYIRASEPFDITELAERGRATVAEGPQGADNLRRPLLLDFRDVALIRQNSSNFSRVIARRQAMSKPGPNNPAAFIVRDQDDYGMMRMYCALAAARGLRELDRTIITDDIGQAAEWLLPFGLRPDLPAGALIARLDSTPASADPPLDAVAQPDRFRACR